MMFTVPAGSALVFTGSDGQLLDTPTTAPLSRQVTVGMPDAIAL